MAITEVYTCDVCKKEKNRWDMANITVKSEGIKINNVDRNYGLQIDICPNCLMKKGITIKCKPQEVEEVDRKNKITLEDKICEILSDIGVMFENKEE